MELPLKETIARDRWIAGWTKGLLLSALAFSIGAFLVSQIYDLDVWWQVAIGRDILAQGAVPAIDRFAAVALGRPYHDSHWLFQVLLAMARATNASRDAEWALQQLAKRALAGEAIPGLSVEG